MTNEEKENTQENPPEKKKSEVIDFLKFLITLLLIVFVIRGTVIEAYRIPSGSMRPTLLERDHILVTKFDYGLRSAFLPKTILQYKTPKRFDIVVFTQEENPNVNFIKRVIALPNETVEVRGTTVYINGVALEEPEQIQWLEGGIVNFGPVKIPEGHVFLLGDNRDHSRDSRFWEKPYLNINRIKGRAQIVYFNLSSLSRIGNIIR